MSEEELNFRNEEEPIHAQTFAKVDDEISNVLFPEYDVVSFRSGVSANVFTSVEELTLSLQPPHICGLVP